MVSSPEVGSSFESCSFRAIELFSCPATHVHSLDTLQVQAAQYGSFLAYVMQSSYGLLSRTRLIAELVADFIAEGQA